MDGGGGVDYCCYDDHRLKPRRYNSIIDSLEMEEIHYIHSHSHIPSLWST